MDCANGFVPLTQKYVQLIILFFSVCNLPHRISSQPHSKGLLLSGQRPLEAVKADQHFSLCLLGMTDIGEHQYDIRTVSAKALSMPKYVMLLILRHHPLVS
ncbi:unnamed protein product [Arabidopsis thaliana]|uniref:Uncharacterized protein n=1 Tax=Arabidopsis thaliana TaxID=3702 RepID=A0A5S9WXQ0_ARATH|nr:unnamed protein product [Arabidopsis thaliana]